MMLLNVLNVLNLFNRLKPLRRLASSLLVLGSLLFVGLAGFAGFAPTAIAAADTPEAAEYQVNEGYGELQKPSQEQEYVDPIRDAKDNIEMGKSSSNESEIKERLNLDEPLPEDTKKFFRQIKGEEPIENERLPNR
jgi:hypothetical protein